MEKTLAMQNSLFNTKKLLNSLIFILFSNFTFAQSLHHSFYIKKDYSAFILNNHIYNFNPHVYRTQKLGFGLKQLFGYKYYFKKGYVGVYYDNVEYYTIRAGEGGVEVGEDDFRYAQTVHLNLGIKMLQSKNKKHLLYSDFNYGYGELIRSYLASRTMHYSPSLGIWYESYLGVKKRKNANNRGKLTIPFFSYKIFERGDVL